MLERIAKPEPEAATAAAVGVRSMSSRPRSSTLLQAKLTVGAVDDPFEREADRVADRVVKQIAQFARGGDGSDGTDATSGRIRPSGLPIARKPLAEQFEHAGRIRRTAQSALAEPMSGGELDDELSGRIRSARGGGSPLPDVLRQPMEMAFGQSFENVRVHTGPGAAELSESISARAFTTGNDVFFGRGAFDPSSQDGQRLLSHELTHVVQQTGATRPLARSIVRPNSAGPPVQRVLDVAAAKAAAKEENSKFARFKKSSLAPVFQAAERYNASPDPWSLALVQFELDCVKRDKVDKYTEAVAKLDAGIRADLSGFLGRADVWSAVAPSLRDDHEVLESAFDVCENGLAKGKLLYRLGGDVAWKEQTMTTFGISQNDSREALVQLGVFETGTAGHKEGPEVDDLIADKLGTFVEKDLETRGKITGRIAVLGAADWEVIGRQQYGEAVWEGGKRDTLNAFVDRSSDPPRVFVNKDRGNAGTAIHEACHMWGDPNRPINSISHDLNEGITEFFARKVCQTLTPPIPRTVYAKQFNIARKLAETVGEDKVGAAFFDGAVSSISQPFGATRWGNFITHINAGDYGRAEAVLEKVSKQADGDDDADDMSESFATIFGGDE